MAGGLPRNSGRLICDFGEIDSDVWESVQDDLFVDESYGQSWAEVFPVDLLLPGQDSLNSVSNADNGRVAKDYEDATPVQLIALDSVKDIAQYIKRTSNFRAFFVRQTHSWSPLLITSSLFDEMLLQAHLPSTLKSFIAYFGAREREVEISPSALRFMRLSGLGTGLTCPHECTYGLRFVERNRRISLGPAFKIWSLRQCAITCHHAPQHGGTTWAFITISERMQQRLNSAAIEGRFRHETDPFELHHLLLDSAISNWRLYLIDLAEETDKQYVQILGTSPTDTGPVSLHASGRRQDLLILDERLLNAMLAIAATVDTTSALSASWESLLSTSQLQDPVYVDLMRSSFEHHRRVLGLLTAEVTQLRSKLAGATNLLSSFLDLSSGYSLQNLAQESSKENEEMRRLTDRMHKLAEKSTQDAAAVKVLTILTLIYLPVTVVSNFFSTSFVNSTTPANGLGNITVTGDWWILFAASIPLTMFTIWIWLVWTRIQANPGRQAWWKYALGVRLLAGGGTAFTLNHSIKPEESSFGRRAYNEATNAPAAHVFRRTSSGLC